MSTPIKAKALKKKKSNSSPIEPSTYSSISVLIISTDPSPLFFSFLLLYFCFLVHFFYASLLVSHYLFFPVSPPCSVHSSSINLFTHCPLSLFSCLTFCCAYRPYMSTLFLHYFCNKYCHHYCCLYLYHHYCCHCYHHYYDYYHHYHLYNYHCHYYKYHK